MPGWLDSDPDHWQSRWQRLYGCERVDQHDWCWPKRGDWMSRLDDVVQARAGRCVLIAHSLGCQLVAAWAAHSAHTARVSGAFLVAVPDTERIDMPPNLHSWRPMSRQRLPFASLMVISSNDPFCASDRAARLALDWGSTLVELGPKGHLNSASALGDWHEGWRLLGTLPA